MFFTLCFQKNCKKIIGLKTINIFLVYLVCTSPCPVITSFVSIWGYRYEIDPVYLCIRDWALLLIMCWCLYKSNQLYENFIKIMKFAHEHILSRIQCDRETSDLWLRIRMLYGLAYHCYFTISVSLIFMDPDYNSLLIYWWGYCNLSICMG